MIPHAPSKHVAVGSAYLYLFTTVGVTTSQKPTCSHALIQLLLTAEPAQLV